MGLASLFVVSALAAAPAPARITHGVATGDVGPHSAVVWARGSGPGRLEVVAVHDEGPASNPVFVTVDASTDYTGHVRLEHLKPDQPYAALVTFVAADGGRSAAIQARFRTAPRKHAARPLRLAFGGDLGGQGRCRVVTEDGTELGYPVLSAVADVHPHLFLLNGDAIYADDTCEAEGRAPREGEAPWRNVPGEYRSVADPGLDWTDASAVQESYWAHWRYNRADAHAQALLARVPLLAQWDDHEVINDFGGEWTTWNPASDDRPGYSTLVSAGRDAFYHYNPLDAGLVEPGGIYRSFRWGKDAEIFLVDARSYRSPNRAPDTKDKTLLGRAQLDWLVSGLVESKATWKIVSVDVPLSVPTGTNAETWGSDGWADGLPDGRTPDGSVGTGFEGELHELLRSLDEAEVKNLVFLTTDVHFAQLARYRLDLDGDGVALQLHELISGPLSAYAADVRAPDPSFGPEILYAEGGFFNFGVVNVRRESRRVRTLSLEIRDANGLVRPGSRLELVAE